MNAWKFLLLMILFNVSVVIVQSLNEFSGGAFWTVAGTPWTLATYGTLTLIISTAGALTGAVLGTSVFNYDPFRGAAITGFGVGMIPTLWNTRLIFYTMASGNAMAGLMVDIFLGFEAILLVVFLYQMATGGWKAHE